MHYDEDEEVLSLRYVETKSCKLHLFMYLKSAMFGLRLTFILNVKVTARPLDLFFLNNIEDLSVNE